MWFSQMLIDYNYEIKPFNALQSPQVCSSVSLDGASAYLLQMLLRNQTKVITALSSVWKAVNYSADDCTVS